jgi:hypothetical protein
MNMRVLLRALIAAAIGFGIGLAAQAKGVDAPQSKNAANVVDVRAR